MLKKVFCLENIELSVKILIYFLTLNDERKGGITNNDKSQFSNFKGAI